MSQGHLIRAIGHAGMNVELADRLGVGGTAAVAETGEHESGAVEGGFGQAVGQYTDFFGTSEKNTFMLLLGNPQEICGSLLACLLGAHERYKFD